MLLDTNFTKSQWTTNLESRVRDYQYDLQNAENTKHFTIFRDHMADYWMCEYQVEPFNNTHSRLVPIERYDGNVKDLIHIAERECKIVEHTNIQP
jgi:hypothetical protein